MDRQDLAHQAEGRQHHDVHGRVGIEPEQMLVDHGIAPERRAEEARVGHDVEGQQDQGSRQHGGGEHHQDAGAQHGPAVHRQLHHRQPGPPELEDGGDEVDPPQDRTTTKKEHAQDPGHLPGRRGGEAEGRVGSPAGLGSTADEIAGDQQQPRGRDQPERHGVQPRVGHVPSPDIKGHQVIAEATVHHGDDPEENHHRAVQRQHLVVGLTAEVIGDGGGQLGADHPRQGTPYQIEEEPGNQVLQADHLVIKAEAQITQPALGLEANGQLGCGGGGHSG